MSFTLADTSDNMESLRVMTIEYKTESDGYIINEPVLQLFARDHSGGRRVVEVEGFYPYFYIAEDEFEQKQDSILQSNFVRRIETREESIDRENSLNSMIESVEESPATTLHNRPLTKIYTVEPKHVAELRDMFEETWEADVFFTDRFKIDMDIDRGIRVPTGETRVHVDEVESATDDTIPEVMPRVCTIDIEVLQDGGFPEPEHASNPITSFTLHDSYTDSYKAGILEPDVNSGNTSWSKEDTIDWDYPDGVSESQIDITVYEDEATMLDAANQWIIEMNPDLLTGWYSSRSDEGNGFDYPYWFNRCENINVWSVEQLSPIENTYVTSSGEAKCQGRVMFDMLMAYKKTQIHEKESYSLEAIAQDELGYGKEDIDDLDIGWREEPVEFMKYNIRDVSAVVEIESAKGVVEMYDHLQYVTGASFNSCLESNFGIVDILLLKRAYNNGNALPTSTVPERGWFYGGKVYDPIPGKHKNVVYPDL
jgi:DNA polymerase elongation subunit (family B)